MTRSTTICDNCDKEYAKGRYGEESVLEFKVTQTDSVPQRMLCHMDLCEKCTSKVKQAIKESLKKPMEFKSEGMGVYY